MYPTEHNVLLCCCAETAKEKLSERLSSRDVAVTKPQAEHTRWGCSWLAHARAWLLDALPASEQQLRLGLQFSACFLAVMFLQIIDDSHTALTGQPVWAVSDAAFQAALSAPAGAACTVGTPHALMKTALCPHRIPKCLPVRLDACRPAGLSACLPAHSPAHPAARLPSRLPA